MMAFIFGFIVAFSVLVMQLMEVGQHLAAEIYTYTGLAQARQIPKDAWAALMVACSGDAQCGAWQSTKFKAGMSGYWFVLVLPVILPMIAAKFFPTAKPVPQKDPGLAKWESKARLKRFMPGQDSPEDPFTGFMGYLKSGTIGGAFDAKELPPMFVPQEDWCQNTLVWGGIRSGKTTAFFQPNIFLAAHLQVSSIVFDVKWPQKNSGFYETLGYWYARGRSVVLLAPFERYGARVNLLAGVNSFSDALSVADAVFPPPEFTEERGKHYNDKKRFLIAAMVWLLRTELGDAATLRHVLDKALLPEDRLSEWIDGIRESEAKLIIEGYREAGDQKFAEDKNGIISALKVFFNENVVYNTSGTGHDAVSLDQNFEEPTLTLVAINMENSLDGSAEVMFRLYKRLLDVSAMRVAKRQGGRLINHLSIWLDELPSIGKLNYMMRSMGALRTYNISHHLGIQNDAQSQLVYGETYWKAISTNVVARVIMFPRGINGDDAKKVSETIGKTSASEVSVSQSHSIVPLTHEGSNGSSSKLVERYLLAFEEFADFSLGEAVVRMNGQHPIRTQLAPMSMKTVEGTAIKKGSRENVLYELYAQTVKACPGGLIDYTTQLIESGVFKNRAKRPRADKAGLPKAPVAPQTPRTPDTAPVTPASQVAAPTPLSGPNLPAQTAFEWLEACMQAFVQITPLEVKHTYSVRASSEDQAINGKATVKTLIVGGLLERSKSGLEYHLSASVMREIPADSAWKQRLEDYSEAAPVHEWVRLNRQNIEGTPEREAYLATFDPKDEQRPVAPLAALIGDDLHCARTVTREMLRANGATLKFPNKRSGSRNLDIIPVGSFAATANAIRQARADGTVPVVTGPSRRERKLARSGVVEAGVMEGQSIKEASPSDQSP